MNLEELDDEAFGSRALVTIINPQMKRHEIAFDRPNAGQ